jgi:hypothetical protein
MLKLDIKTNFPDVMKGIDRDAKQARFAAKNALNRTAKWAETTVRKSMLGAFHQPTTYFLRSLRIIYAYTGKLQVALWFKDRGLQDSAEAMVVPHVEGGGRKHKPMELRLQRAGLMPAGWFAVPGGGADIDANGNMSRGQITTLLNVLGTYKEAGYNKANAKTVERLAKGNAKKGIYGFTYWVNPVSGPGRARHIPPGVYKRVQTGFGSSLKPVLIFVSRAMYRKRFDFYAIVRKVFDERFAGEFDKAYAEAMRTAR